MSKGEGSSRKTQLLEAALLAAWFVYLLIAPTRGFFWIDAWHNEQRAVQSILLAATGVIAVVLPGFRATLVPRSGVAYAVWAMAVIAAASALHATLVWPAFAELSLHVMLAVLAVITAASVRRDPAGFSIWLRRACVLLALVHVIGIAARYIGMLALQRPVSVEVLLLGYANPRFPTALYALLLPFVAAFVKDVRERAAFRYVAFGSLTLLWSINMALGTRAIWFAYALAVPLMLLLVGWQRIKPVATALATSALSGALVYYALFIAIPAWLGLGSALQSRMDQLTTLSARGQLWEQSWQAMATEPLLGLGPMNFAALGDSFAAHPHNWILQLGTEWGIPALLLALWVLWRLGREFWRSQSAAKRDDSDLVAPLAATVIGLAYGLVDGNLVMPVSQTVFAFSFGVALGYAFAAAAAGAPADRVRVALGAACVLASALCLLAYVLVTLPQQAASEAAWRRTSQHPNFAPRFWQQGLLR